VSVYVQVHFLVHYEQTVSRAGNEWPGQGALRGEHVRVHR